MTVFRSSRLLATSTVSLGLVLFACGSEPAASPVPASTESARVGCLDRPGTVTATARQWYTSDGGGALDTGHQPVGTFDPDFAPDVEAALTAAFPDAGVHGGDLDEESTTSGGCATVRWFDLWDDTGHSYFVEVWRPESRVDLSDDLGFSSYAALNDHVLVGKGPNSTGLNDIVVLAVAPDGTTVQLLVRAEQLPPQEAVVRAAQDILDRVLADRP